MSRRLLVLPLLLVPSNLLADDWQFMGPKDFGARVLSLAVDPKNADHAFAGSESGEPRTAAPTGRSGAMGYPGVMSVELLLFERDRLLRLVTHGKWRVATEVP